MSHVMSPPINLLTADILPVQIPGLEQMTPVTEATDLELEISCRMKVVADSCEVTDPNQVLAELEARSPDGSSQKAEIRSVDLVPDGNCLGEHAVSKRLSVPVTVLAAYTYTVSGNVVSFVFDEGVGITLEMGFSVSFGSYSYTTEYLAPAAGVRIIEDKFSMLAAPPS